MQIFYYFKDRRFVNNVMKQKNVFSKFLAKKINIKTSQEKINKLYHNFNKKLKVKLSTKKFK